MHDGDGEGEDAGSSSGSSHAHSPRGHTHTHGYNHNHSSSSSSHGEEDFRFCSAQDDNVAIVWSYAAAAMLFQITGRSITCIAHLPLDLLATATDRLVCVWSVSQGRQQRTLRGHSKTVTCLAVVPPHPYLYPSSPPRCLLASGSDDCSVLVWDACSGACLRRLEGPGQPLTCLLLSTHMGRLSAAGGAWGGALHTWALGTAREMGVGGAITSATTAATTANTTTGSSTGTGSTGSTTAIATMVGSGFNDSHTAPAPAPAASLQHTNRVTSLCPISISGSSSSSSGSSSGSSSRHSSSSRRSSTGSSSSSRCIPAPPSPGAGAGSPLGAGAGAGVLFASSSLDGSIRVWLMRKENNTTTTSASASATSATNTEACDNYDGYRSSDGSDVEGAGPGAGVGTGAGGGTGAGAASSGLDSSISCVAVLTCDRVSDICLITQLSDGRLAVAALDNAIVLYPLPTGEISAAARSNSCAALVLSSIRHGASAIAPATTTTTTTTTAATTSTVPGSASAPGTGTGTGTGAGAGAGAVALVIKGLSSRVTALSSIVGPAAGAPMELLITGSDDYMVRLYSTQSGACVRALDGHTGSVTCMQSLADGRLLTGSDDGSVLLWNLSSSSRRSSHPPGQLNLNIPKAKSKPYLSLLKGKHPVSSMLIFKPTGSPALSPPPRGGNIRAHADIQLCAVTSDGVIHMRRIDVRSIAAMEQGKGSAGNGTSNIKPKIASTKEVLADNDVEAPSGRDGHYPLIHQLLSRGRLYGALDAHSFKGCIGHHVSECVTLGLSLQPSLLVAGTRDGGIYAFRVFDEADRRAAEGGPVTSLFPMP
jgi:WD40 repeat protein